MLHACINDIGSAPLQNMPIHPKRDCIILVFKNTQKQKKTQKEEDNRQKIDLQTSFGYIMRKKTNQVHMNLLTKVRSYFSMRTLDFFIPRTYKTP